MPRRAGRYARRGTVGRNAKFADRNPRTVAASRATAVATAVGPVPPATGARHRSHRRVRRGIPRRTIATTDPPREERLPRGGAHVGVLPMLCVGLSEEDCLSGPGPGGRNHHGAVAVPLDVRDFVQFARRASRRTTATRPAIRQAFGIDFLLDGTVQRSRNKLRITLRLLDLRAGNQVVWARRFDRQADDLLSVQDEIAAEVVAQIDPEILLIEAKTQRGAAAGRCDGVRSGVALDPADDAA